MGLLDRVKKLVKPEKQRKARRSSKKTVASVEYPQAEAPREKKPQKRETAGPAPAKSDTSQAWRVVISPVISEKATDLHARGQYVFKVKSHANKVEIRKAVGALYGVRVTGVRVINIPRKSRRLGRSQGYKAGYKKAVVSVKKGDKIELLPH